MTRKLFPWRRTYLSVTAMLEKGKSIVQNIKNEAKMLGTSTQALVLEICRCYLQDKRINGDG